MLDRPWLLVHWVDYGQSVRFGVFITPEATERPLQLAAIADDLGFDIAGVQDHPYQRRFYDTWTLLTAIAMRTERISVFPDVANVPLRPPALLAKAAATLDILTNGRLELGLGAGGFWEGIVSYGGVHRTPGEAVSALEEAIALMRTLWQPIPPNQTVNFSGHHYQLVNAHPGPTPAHPIGIWLGALRPKMLRLTGQKADGLLISSSYIPPEDVPRIQQTINEAALQAGRDPLAIRRGYNLMGTITQPGSRPMVARRKGVIIGTTQQWVDELLRYYHELKLDTFFFWPVMGEEERQSRIFAEEVVPAILNY